MNLNQKSMLSNRPNSNKGNHFTYFWGPGTSAAGSFFGGSEKKVQNLGCKLGAWTLNPKLWLSMFASWELLKAPNP